jgi:hypothetical protein
MDGSGNAFCARHGGGAGEWLPESAFPLGHSRRGGYCRACHRDYRRGRTRETGGRRLPGLAVRVTHSPALHALYRGPDGRARLAPLCGGGVQAGDIVTFNAAPLGSRPRVSRAFYRHHRRAVLWLLDARQAWIDRPPPAGSLSMAAPPERGRKRKAQ